MKQVSTEGRCILRTFFPAYSCMAAVRASASRLLKKIRNRGGSLALSRLTAFMQSRKLLLRWLVVPP